MLRLQGPMLFSVRSALQIIHMSGIMALFFCAIFLAHYNWYNISPKGQHATHFGFKG